MLLRTAADLKEGVVLAGKYRVERVIGAGGMGVVVSAIHLDLGTTVAVKLLLSATGDLVERFSREARAASRLKSEHAVRVFDVGKHADGTPFFVMEHLVGEDLDSLLARQGPLDAGATVGFVLQACEAVAEAHAMGIVHRDLKPKNLFLTRRVDGSVLVKVLDFGIAKSVASDGGTSLTGPLLLGSPPYMSPEQMRASANVDIRTDIWSLGVCLYELLTGVLPFEAASDLETIAVVLTGNPTPPADLRPTVPLAMSDVIMRCLRKEPERRFRDLGEFAEALEPFAPPTDRGASSRIRRVLSAPIIGGDTTGREASTPLPALRADASSRTEASQAVRRRRAAWTAMAAVATIGVTAAALTFSAALRGGRPDRARREKAEISEPASSLAPAAVAPVAAAVASPAPVDTSSILSVPQTEGPRLRTLSPPHRRPVEGMVSPRAVNLPPAPVVPMAAVPPTPVPAPVPVLASEPPHPTPFLAVAQASDPTSSTVATVALPPASATASPPPAAAPSFALESARVTLGAPGGVVGTTASNITRGLARAEPRLTACYRDALPRMAAPFEGSGTLHVESDEEGVIVASRVAGALAGAVGPCIAAAVRGLTIPSVDTGRARADVPLLFNAR
jgi:serine/threonine-protein kinase